MADKKIDDAKAKGKNKDEDKDDTSKVAKQLKEIIDYDINKTTRTILISSAIGTNDDECDFRFINACFDVLEERSKKKKIVMKINSPGGDFYETLAMVGRMEESPCYVVTKGFGHMCSGAAILLISGDMRMMSKHSILMFHESRYGTFGEHQRNKDYVEQAEKEMDRMCELLANKSFMSIEWWKEKLHKKDFYLTSKEALQYGIIDKEF